MGKQAALCVIQGKAGFIARGFNAKNYHQKNQKRGSKLFANGYCKGKRISLMTPMPDSKLLRIVVVSSLVPADGADAAAMAQAERA